MIRPRVGLPTGTEIGFAVFFTVEPRRRPSDAQTDGTDNAVAQLLLDFERQFRAIENSAS